MINISANIQIHESELQFDAIRAQGSGGQNVNKVSTAIHLRFDIPNSSLPQRHKTQLLSQSDQRISQTGILVIKAQRFRTQEKNKEDAVQRLIEFIQMGIKKDKKRIATRPTKASKRRRTDSKVKRGKAKKLRGKVDF